MVISKSDKLVRSVLLNFITPEFGLSRSAKRCNNVLFPEPEGPNRETIELSANVKLRSDKTFIFSLLSV